MEDLKKIKKVEYPDLIKNVDLISLELTNQSTLGGISKIQLVKDRIYVLDRTVNQIVGFSRDGKFIERLSNPGEGPNEIHDIHDFSYNSYSNSIEIMSPKGKVISYNLDSQIYKLEVNQGENLMPNYGFDNINEDLIVFYTDFRSHFLAIYSRKQQQIVGRHLENDIDPMFGLSNPGPLRSGKEGKIDFFNPYTQALYVIDDKNVNEKHTLDLGNYHLDLKSRSTINGVEASGDLLSYLQENSFLFPISNYIEDDKIVSFGAIYEGKDRLVLLYSKETKKWTYTDISKFGRFIPFMQKNEDNYYGVFTNTRGNTDIIDELFQDDPRYDLDEVYATQNPILIKFQLNLN